MNIGQFSQELDATLTSAIRIVPAGRFRPSDGRAMSVASWNMDSKNAKNVIAASFANQKEILIDYEHQSLKSANNGQPVPAAGWFKTMEWRDGLGLFAAEIAWNAKAKEMIKAGEYRFISPVIVFDDSGAVTRVVSIALTNTPALPYLTDLANVPLSAQRPAQIDPQNQRGYELLAKMVQATEPAGTSQTSPASRVNPITLDAVRSAATENQRGMELLHRMNQK